MNPKHSPLARLAVCTLAAFAFTGCKHAIKYDLEMVRPVRGARLPATLDVEPLADKRATVMKNRVLFEVDNQANLNGVDMCVNAESRYEAGTVNQQISGLLQEHLARRGRFKQVILGQKQSADYHLSGTLRSFYGAQEQSGPAKVGAMFGLIGALATMNLTTEGEIRIELVDLKLLRQDGSLVAQLPNVSEVVKDQLPVDAHCGQIYFTMDERLRDALDKLARSVEQSVEQAITAPAAPAVTANAT